MKYHFMTVETGSRLCNRIDKLGHRIGWTGVDFFFVLSGFLVGGLLVQELLRSSDLKIGRFLARRALKIWPAYYVYLLFQVILRRHPIGSFLWQNSFNVQNYTGTSLAHTWSLAVEEHFYLLLPPVLWLCFRYARRQTPLVLGLLCVATLIERMVMVYTFGVIDPQRLTHARIDSLLFGVLLSWFFYSQRTRFDRLLQQKILLSAICLIGLAIAIHEGRQTRFMWTFGFTTNYLAYGALLLLVYQYQGPAIRSWPYRFVAWIGLYSYGIYLWHLSVREPINHLVSHLPKSIQWGSLLITQYVAAIVLGIVMTKLVEFPMLRVRERIFPRGPAKLAPATP